MLSMPGADSIRSGHHIRSSLIRSKATAWLLPPAFCFVVISSCTREPYQPTAPAAAGAGSPLRLVLTADVTAGTVPLTVNFTGTLLGRIDTPFTLVPELSLEGGYNPEEELYTPAPDTITIARKSYTGREHYFHRGTFNAVMIVHGTHRDILSDTVHITVQ